MYGRRYTNAQKAVYYAKLARKNNYNGRRSYGTASGMPIKYVRGKGDYYQRLKANYKKPYSHPGLGKRLGAAAGSAIGSFVLPGLGGAIGGALGGAAGQLGHAAIKTVTGHGDYTVAENSLIFNRDAVPEFSTGERVTHIKHKEFIGDLGSTVNFNLSQYEINPANPILFPWLSGIAQNFEQWVCQGMIFQFKTTSATAVASTNTALGTVIMATQYNSYAPPFINKIQMENYEFAQSTVPCESIMHPIECDPKQTMCNGLFFVNNDGYSANADKRLYNIGTFNVATTGSQAASVVGELWVTYDICFLKPKLQGNTAIADSWIIPPATVSSALPLGSNAVLSTTSTSFENASTREAITALYQSPWSGVSNNNYLYINPNYVGTLIISYYCNSPGGTAYVDPTISLFGNCVLNSAFFNSQTKNYSNTDVQVQRTICITCNGGLAGGGLTFPYLVFSGATLPALGNATECRLNIFSVPANLSN